MLNIVVVVFLNQIFTFLEQNQLSSVDANMCDMVPNLWNNIAENCMTKIKAKKNTNTRPIGSNCKYSFEINTWKYIIQVIYIFEL